MGVLGLWQLLAPVGQPVSLESLENKVFAVDISIWLNQALKGYRDSEGGSVANAHLMSLFTRLCKLMFYRIRPIIVFDGAVPELKKQTVINRQHRRDIVKQNTRQAGIKLLASYMASEALKAKKGNLSKSPTSFIRRSKSQSRKDDDIFMLPPLPVDSSADDYMKAEIELKFGSITQAEMKYLSKIDIESDEFASLPADIKLEILTSLKENKRHRTWEEHENLPDDSNDFSSYQMQCLLKRRKVQKKLEDVRSDMRKTSSADIIALYDSEDQVFGETSKIMSEDSAHCIFLKRVPKSSDDKLVVTESCGPDKEDTLVPAKTKHTNIDDEAKIKCANIDEAKFKRINIDEAKINCINTDGDAKIKLINIDDEVIIKHIDDEAKIKHIDEIKIKCINTDDEAKIKRINIDEEKIKPVNMDNRSHQTSDNSAPYNDSSLGFLSEPEGDSELSYSACKSFNNSIIESNSDIELEFHKNVHSVIVSENMKMESDSCSRVGSSGNFNKKGSDVSKAELHLVVEKHSEVLQTNSLTDGKKILLRSHTKVTDKPTSDSSNLLVASAYRNFPSENQRTIDPSVPESENVSLTRNKEASSIVRSKTINLMSDSVQTDASESVHFDVFEQKGYDEALPARDFSSLSDSEDHSDNDIYEALGELASSQAALEAKRAKQQRQASTVQEHMYEECQELLRLFGIPYIISPTEAEAQCAFLDRENITHGTITDDSDIWLFGGKRVYKNFFTQNKFVECYKDNEILSHFGLTRSKLINFALLTGSDYTEGIEGVGPVTAMEILSEFSMDGFEGMCTFKKYWDIAQKYQSPPKNRVRAKLQKLPLSPGFPSCQVYEAYLNPTVDKSMESFTWGRPDVDALRDYTREKFGWNKSKVDDNLLPVIKRLNEKTAQTHLDSFFTISLKKQENLFPSKRIMSALKKIHSPLDGSDSNDAEPVKKTAKKSKGKAVVSQKSGTSKKQISKCQKSKRLSKKVIIPDTVCLSESSDDST